jgi:hypothetical protein
MWAPADLAGSLDHVQELQFFLIVNATTGVGSVQMPRSVALRVRQVSIFSVRLGARLQHIVENGSLDAPAALLIS